MRILHLKCDIIRPPRKPGLTVRYSIRDVTLAYEVQGAQVVAGLAFTHTNDTFIKKLGSARAVESYQAHPFEFYLGRADLPVVEWTDEIVRVLSAHGRSIIPNLPYTKEVAGEYVFDIENIYFSRRK